MKIVGLFVYPIKGCGGTSLASSALDAQGLCFDRRWMIVRAEEGKFLSQREIPHLARIRPHATTSGLHLTFDSDTPLDLPALPDDTLPRRIVSVWGFQGEALDEGDIAADWLTAIVGFPCRLVRTPEDFTRRVSAPENVLPDRVGFADAYPVLLASLSSLDDLNARLLEKGADSVPMDRFRPNIVVSGTAAWEEDTWATLTVVGSEMTFRVAKPCARCSVTTVHQQTGEKTGTEPLATLAGFRRDAKGKVNFAANLLHDKYGPDIVLRVGDTLLPFPQ